MLISGILHFISSFLIEEMAMTVVQLSDVRLARRVSRLLPRISSRKQQIINDICMSTTEYPPEWLRVQLERNFEDIINLILAGDTTTDLLGKCEIRDELEILELLS